MSGTITSLAASIRVRAESIKQDIKPALEAIDSWGKAAKEAGLDTATINREMAKMRAEAARGPKQAAEATDNLRQKLSAAKQGAAALTGAVSAMSSEVGGTVGHVTRLGTSLTSAFLAGGPVALGVTALAAGISAIAGASNEAAEAARRAGEEHHKWVTGALDDVAKLKAESVDRERLEAAGGDPKMAERLKQEAEIAGQLENHRTLIVEAGRAIEELVARREVERKIIEDAWKFGVIRVAEAKAAEKELTEEIKRRIERIDASDAIVGELLKKQRDLRDAASREADARERSLEADKARAKLAEAGDAAAKKRVADLEAEREAAAEVAAERAESDRQSAARNKELNDRMSAAYGMEAKMAGDAARAKQAAEQKLASDGGMAAAEKRAEELRAIVDAEEAAAAAGKQAAAAAKEKAEAEKQATEAVREQARLVGQRKDITKRFSNPGGGLFGFGAGQAGTGIGDIGADAARARRAAGDIPGKGGGAAAALAAGAAKLPDVGADVKAMDAEIAKLPSIFEKLGGAVTAASATTRRAVTSFAQTTERTTAALRSDQEGLAADLRALEAEVRRAGGGSGAGE